MVSGRITKNAADLLANQSVIQAAYVFGSTVNGIDRTSSDVDIAIRLVPEVTAEAAFDLKLQLMVVSRLVQTSDCIACRRFEADSVAI